MNFEHGQKVGGHCPVSVSLSRTLTTRHAAGSAAASTAGRMMAMKRETRGRMGAGVLLVLTCQTFL